jgi:hypothetical protein
VEASTEPIAAILEHGSDDQRQALHGFARVLLDTTAATAAPAEQLPGLGARPGPPEMAAALRRNAERLWRARRELYGEAPSYRQAADLLGVSTNQITNLVSAGDLLALDGADGAKLPAWQFHPEARRGRLEGIGQVAAVFPGRVLGLSAWTTTPTPLLGGRTPAAALLDGDVDDVVAAAAAQR